MAFCKKSKLSGVNLCFTFTSLLHAHLVTFQWNLIRSGYAGEVFGCQFSGTADVREAQQV